MFIDGSVSGIKAALLSKDGLKPPVIILIWNNAKENYATLKEIFDLIKNVDEQWELCADFKVLQLVMGLRNGRNIKNPCFFACTTHKVHNVNQN